MIRASSRNAVSLSSARTTKRFPSRRCPTVACSCCLAHGTRRNLTRGLRFNRGGWGSAVSEGSCLLPARHGCLELGPRVRSHVTAFDPIPPERKYGGSAIGACFYSRPIFVPKARPILGLIWHAFQDRKSTRLNS